MFNLNLIFTSSLRLFSYHHLHWLHLYALGMNSALLNS